MRGTVKNIMSNSGVLNAGIDSIFRFSKLGVFYTAYYQVLNYIEEKGWLEEKNLIGWDCF